MGQIDALGSVSRQSVVYIFEKNHVLKHFFKYISKPKKLMSSIQN